METTYNIYYDINEKHVETYINKTISDYFTNINKVEDLSLINKQTHVILFKEIRDVNEIEELDKLNKQYPNLSIILLSYYESLIFESLKIRPIYFIRLNQIENDTIKALDILNKTIMDSSPYIVLKAGHSYIQLPKNSILYLESYGHYLYVHTKQASYKVRNKLVNVLEQLDNSKFIRIHKSYIINLNAVKALNNKDITIYNNDCVPIGRSYRTAVMNIFKSNT